MRAPVGIVPAAGHATRLQPLGCSKEALPVGGRPLIAHLLERLAVAGASDIRVVTRPEKHDVRELAADHRVVLAHPPELAASIALGLSSPPTLRDDDVVLVGFPDALWLPRDGFATLRDRVGAGADVALGLFGVAEPSRSDVVVCDGAGRVVDIAIKPADPPGSRIWGCFAARADALAGLGECTWPSEHFLALAAAGGRVEAVHLSDTYLDVGTPAALAAAEGWLEDHVAAA